MVKKRKENQTILKIQIVWLYITGVFRIWIVDKIRGGNMTLEEITTLVMSMYHNYNYKKRGLLK